MFPQVAPESRNSRSRGRELGPSLGGRARLATNDLVVVDEASMVTSGQLAELNRMAEAAGAKLLLTGDPEQLAAVGDSGAFAMLAREHGYYQLTQVQRMAEPWEREAWLAPTITPAEGVLSVWYGLVARTDGSRIWWYRPRPSERGHPLCTFAISAKTVAKRLAADYIEVFARPVPVWSPVPGLWQVQPYAAHGAALPDQN
ncbi:AAA family ATPase [Microtetraspora sp. NBRC 16547]|uniref:AAA family ATPase n=1 Tax=Microtetraspora sp. NBRC 16547 TaxID=3030993 RepID=UPI0024A100FB|nr:AAA family ATPase [Microtetraspora sp. NBRC 16547]GLX02949.1 hypothetical protein Misp02_70350 [Microtetraspora sp. NBRC 16547]